MGKMSRGATGVGKIGVAPALVETKMARALWYVAPHRVELRQRKLVPPGPGEALVEMIWSSISRGTERLVFAGRVPVSEYERLRGPLQEGDFPYPVKYGYCAVGRVVEGPGEWLGQTVFALHPHQDRFVVPVTALTPVPDRIPLRRATLAANMETALNAVWDGGAGPGDRIAVIGAGVVGLLIAAVAGGMPGAEVTVIDIAAERRPVAEALGATFLLSPQDDHRIDGFDIVFHASASATGLPRALAAAGLEATVVEVSWYGDARVELALGGAFHGKRLRLLSSQVGHVAPSHRPRWTADRRLAKSFDLLDDDRLDALITAEVAFTDLPARIAAILAPGASGLATTIRY
jgi:2-desacetyl-2-hydroxyethyl bacteriochlorophyllide A dehydrogenase